MASDGFRLLLIASDRLGSLRIASDPVALSEGASQNSARQCGCFDASCPYRGYVKSQHGSGHDCFNVLAKAVGADAISFGWPQVRALVASANEHYELPRCDDMDEGAVYASRSCAHAAGDRIPAGGKRSALKMDKGSFIKSMQEKASLEKGQMALAYHPKTRQRMLEAAGARWRKEKPPAKWRKEKPPPGGEIRARSRRDQGEIKPPGGEIMAGFERGPPKPSKAANEKPPKPAKDKLLFGGIREKLMRLGGFKKDDGSRRGLRSAMKESAMKASFGFSEDAEGIPKEALQAMKRDAMNQKLEKQAKQAAMRQKPGKALSAEVADATPPKSFERRLLGGKGTRALRAAAAADAEASREAERPRVAVCLSGQLRVMAKRRLHHALKVNMVDVLSADVFMHVDAQDTREWGNHARAVRLGHASAPALHSSTATMH